MKKYANILTIFHGFILNYRKQFFILFGLLLFEGLIATLSIVAVVPLTDFLIDSALTKPSKPSQIVFYWFQLTSISVNFWTLGFLFIFINLFRCLISVAVRYAILIIKYDVLGGLTLEAIRTFFSARWGFFSRADQGKLLNTMYKEVGNVGDALGHIATMMAQCVQLVVYLTMPLLLSPTLTITAIALVSFFGIPFFLLSNLSYKLGKKNIESSNDYVGVISETFSSTRLILSFARQNQALDRYMRSYRVHVEATLRSQTLNAAVHTLFQPMAMLAVVISIGITLNNGTTSIAEIAAIMWSLLSAMPLIGGILQGKIGINNFLPSYEQLFSLKEMAAECRQVQGKHIFSGLKKNIVIRNVSFTYPGRPKTLSGINLEMHKGEVVALIGESGSGKSTITDLILGLEMPDQGCILIDDVPLVDWDVNSFREKIGYVSQEPQLFRASIRDNLLWSNPGASEEDMWSALYQANAASFVKDLPQQLNTIAGERGVLLSGGQRQRIALARALIRKPELLILDEATSALDSESEGLIQKSIENLAGGVTILIIAHRLSTIAKSDRVYVLDKGCVVEDGEYSILKDLPGGVLNAMLSFQLEK